MLKGLLLKLAPSYLPNIIRQVGLSAGGALVSSGFLNASDAETVAGAIAILLSAAWAFAEKKGLLAKLAA